MADTDALPDDVPTLKAMIARQQAEIAHLQLWIAKLRRQQFGRRSERADNLLGQLELHLEELEVGAAERAVRLEPARQVVAMSVYGFRPRLKLGRNPVFFHR